MKKIGETIFTKAGSLLSSIALNTALKTSNATCMYMAYQPKEPIGLEKFKK